MALRFLHGGTKRPTTAFVLGGGGNLGAVQVGMLTALLEHGVRPDVIVGASAGALNGAVLAADPTPHGARQLAQLWCGMDAHAVFPAHSLSAIWGLARRALAIGENHGLRALLEHSLPYRHFEETAVPLHVVATSLASGVGRWFSSGPVVEPVLASAALPAVYPPVRIDGELYVDGGVVDNVPISRAVELGAERVYVCHVGNFDRQRPTPRRPIDVLLQSFSIARNYRFLAESSQGWPGVELVVLPGVDPGPLRRNDFRQTRALIAKGRAAADAALSGAEPGARRAQA